MQMSFELDLDSGRVHRSEEPRARWSDPVTSKQAAAQAKDLAAQHKILILGALRRGAAGVDRIALVTNIEAHAVGKRMAELQRAGAIVLTGLTVLSTSGRAQREWKLA